MLPSFMVSGEGVQVCVDICCGGYTLLCVLSDNSRASWVAWQTHGLSKVHLLGYVITSNNSCLPLVADYGLVADLFKVL